LGLDTIESESKYNKMQIIAIRKMRAVRAKYRHKIQLKILHSYSELCTDLIGVLSVL